MSLLHHQSSFSVTSKSLLNDSHSPPLPDKFDAECKISTPGSFEISEEGKSTANSGKKPTRNPVLGYFFMFLAVSGITCGHIFSKLAFNRNPNLGSIDWVTFFGIWLSIVYISWARIKGVKISVTSLPKKPLVALLMSIVVTLCVQLGFFTAITMIPVGKSTLIYSTNPIFSVILSFFVLRERISKSIIWSALGAFVGIYFLSINEENESEHEHDLILGIILVLIWAWLQAMIFVLVRMISSHNIHFTVRPANVGIFFLGFIIFYNIILLTLGHDHTFQYDFMDCFLLSCVGFGSWMCIGPLSLAMQYEEASKLSPLLYTENIFTLLADGLIFNCIFVYTDYIGIGIVAICLLIPVVAKLYLKS